MALPDRLSKGKTPKAADPPVPAAPDRRPSRRRLRRIAIGMAVLVVGLVLFGYFAAPPIIKSILTSTLSEQLHRQVSVGRIAINPFLLTVEIDDFTVQERDGGARFVGFDQPAVGRRDLRAADGSINLMKLAAISKGAPALDKLRPAAEPPSAEKQSGPGLSIKVGGIRLDAARIAFADLVPGGGFRTTLGPVNATVCNFDTVPSAIADAVKVALPESADVAPERLFLVEAKAAADTAGKGKTGRVDFTRR